MEQGEGEGLPPKKVQSDAVSSDVPTKKLARQLDFTGFGGVSASVALQERPQSQPQVVVMPVGTHSTHPAVRVVKPDSPKARQRLNVEAKDGTPKKQKQCNCKHSRCLKLYCECFASGIYCDGCNCVNCHNNVENEAARREAVEATLERNPNAFRPKIASSPHGTRDSREEAGEVLVLGKHNKGCHCKKSGCLKKYCECFQANILCSDNCKCMDCKNFEGSEERQALFHGDHANNIADLQQAANAAITGAIGSSGYALPPLSKKRKGPELFFGLTTKDSSVHRLGHLQMANHTKASSSSSFLSATPVPRIGGTAALGPSKLKYRSLLADIIQPQDLKELCSVLVVVSEEAAKTIADQRNKAEDQMEPSLASSNQDRGPSQKKSDVEKVGADDRSSATQADKIVHDDSSSDGAELPKGRPVSPGTLALMCDEQDTMFMETSSPVGLIGPGCNASSKLPDGQGVSEVYAEQERIILTKFRDCLNRLITFGEIKETKCSSLARTEIGSQNDRISTDNSNVRTETGNQQLPVSNGVAKTVVQCTMKIPQMVTTAASNNDVPKVPSLPENGGIHPKIEKDM